MAAPAQAFHQAALLTLRPILLLDPEPLPAGEGEALRRLRRSLDPAVAARLLTATELADALARTTREEFLTTGLGLLDALLGGGLPRGKVVEVTGRRAAGRYSIAIASLAAATASGEAAVLIDLGDHFDPQIASTAGVDLRRLLWIRPNTLRQAVMSAEMITAAGFQLVVFDAGLHPLRGRRVPDATWVRLGRAAEAHRAAMLVSTPYPLTATASEAVIKTHTRRATWVGRVLMGLSIEAVLEKHRQMRTGRTAELTFLTAEAQWGAGRIRDTP